ncbi:MAG: hypothetical protein QM534_14710 [Sediminibacterium sp.]|nr:hypothetical protein [Sediminibacterium sp.]
MFKKAIIFFLVFFVFTLSAQRKSTKNSRNKRTPRPFSFDLYYGHSIANNNYYNQLNSTSSINFNRPIRQIGIGYSNLYLFFSGGAGLCNQMGFYYYINTPIHLNDTLTPHLSGYAYSFAFGKSFFKQSKYFILNTYIGFNTGRTVLRNVHNAAFKNPFFAPKLLIQPKIFTKRLCFSLLLHYCHDTSGKNWKLKSGTDSGFRLERFDQSNYGVLAAIGYCL